MEQSNAFKGKWALVTGSSRGVGQKVAEALAGHGCNVIVHGRKIENTGATMEILAGYETEAFAVAAELGNVEEETAMIKEIVEKVGGVDILYNNAAIMGEWNDDVFLIDPTEWEQVFSVNIFAMVRVCAAFIPGMIEKGWGRVINLSSGIADLPQLSPYAVSKAAVDRYTDDLRVRLKGTGVIASILDPGWLKTDMGGEQADNEVASVLPGALVPALLADDAESGVFYRAQDYSN